MNTVHPVRYVVAGALIANAIVGHLLYRGGFHQRSGIKLSITAAVITAFVGGIAVVIAVRPTALALLLARGSAALMLLMLAGIGMLFVFAANFESGISAGSTDRIMWAMVLLIAQVAILVGCSLVDGSTVVESIGRTAAGAFLFWLVVVAVILMTEILVV